MGNTCAAYWMPPIAVIAPTMIANGGSDSKGMCSVFCLCVSRVLSNKFFEEQKEKEKEKEKRRTFVCVAF